MKSRTDGFLSKDKICHESEQFDYIRELHDYLWAFVRCQLPTASGKLGDYLDIALKEAQSRAQAKNTPTSDESNCNTPLVSNQREQLIAFAQWLAHDKEYGDDGAVGTVDIYLKSN